MSYNNNPYGYRYEEKVINTSIGQVKKIIPVPFTGTSQYTFIGGGKYSSYMCFFCGEMCMGMDHECDKSKKTYDDIIGTYKKYEEKGCDELPEIYTKHSSRMIGWKPKPNWAANLTYEEWVRWGDGKFKANCKEWEKLDASKERLESRKEYNTEQLKNMVAGSGRLCKTCNEYMIGGYVLGNKFHWTDTKFIDGICEFCIVDEVNMKDNE
jgi:hypothetical protein